MEYTGVYNTALVHYLVDNKAQLWVEMPLRIKKADGKNKMSIINAVRNKLVHRVFAVIRDEQMFEQNYTRQYA